uniref:Velvet domain-containing protein n=1 Tax=Gongylonema pulchrum TaxID=637853 RepID=A0A183D9W3_9BILA
LEMKQHRLRPPSRREHLYGSVELLVTSEPDGQQRSVGRFRLEPSTAPHLVRSFKKSLF